MVDGPQVQTLDWAQITNDSVVAAFGAFAGFVFALLAALITAVVVRRRTRQALLRARALEIMSNTDYLRQLPQTVTGIQANAPPNQSPTLRTYVRSGISDTVSQAAWANPDSGILEDVELAEALRQPYSAVPIIRNTEEAVVVAITANLPNAGAVAFGLLSSLAGTAHPTARLFENALNALYARGLKL